MYLWPNTVVTAKSQNPSYFSSLLSLTSTTSGAPYDGLVVDLPMASLIAEDYPSKQANFTSLILFRPIHLTTRRRRNWGWIQDIKTDVNAYSRFQTAPNRSSSALG
ncbi:hypothetical protein FRB93_002123 [Tulasnella sp. JGI-2019a]|nr:hypothetical protein FRB93_002123 [Tulasnella sp. JGI-2019a]